MNKKRIVTVGELVHMLKYYPNSKEVCVMADVGESFVFRGPITEEWDGMVVLYVEKNQGRAS